MNVELLRRVQEQIREEPRRINMGTWEEKTGSRTDPTGTGLYLRAQGLPLPPCGTIACIGGWALTLMGQPVRKTSGSVVIEADARTLLGLDGPQGARLFYVANWPSQFRNRLGSMGLNGPGTETYAQVVVERIDHFITTEGRE